MTEYAKILQGIPVEYILQELIERNLDPAVYTNFAIFNGFCNPINNQGEKA